MMESNAAGAGRSTQLIPEVLPGADMRGAQLIGVDLSGRNLMGCCFDGADLGRANLAGAKLAGASFIGASMYLRCQGRPWPDAGHVHPAHGGDLRQ